MSRELSLHCLPAVELLPAAVLSFCSPPPTSLHWARGQLKAKCTGHWLERGTGVTRVKKTEVSELRDFL